MHLLSLRIPNWELSIKILTGPDAQNASCVEGRESDKTPRDDPSAYPVNMRRGVCKPSWRLTSLYGRIGVIDYYIRRFGQ
jgi:hypothetical protein